MSIEKLPDSWLKVDVGNIADVISGGTPKSGVVENFTTSGDGIAWLTPADLSGYKDKYISNGARDLTEKGYSSSSAKLMPAGSILFSSRAPIGYTAVAANKISTNQGFKNFVFTSDIYPNYAYYYFRSIKHLAESMGTGTTFKEISGSSAKKLPFIISPLAEQKIIADKLDDLLVRVESIKIRLENIPEILKKFRQSVLSAAVSGKLTEEWRVYNRESLSLEEYKTSLGNFKSKAKGLKPIIKKETWLSCQLGHVISVSSGNSLTAKEMKPDGNIPVYGGNGINGYHDQSNVKESKVVIGRVGFYCGSVHLTENIAWVTDNALIVDFSEDILIKSFVFWMLSATNLREDSASTAQPVISGTKIYSIPLQIPPVAEQLEIVHIIEEYVTFSNRIEYSTQAALNRVNNLTQSILAKAFRGELTAQWREENSELISGLNSAEALLEKITAEKLASGTVKKRAKKISL